MPKRSTRRRKKQEELQVKEIVLQCLKIKVKNQYNETFQEETETSQYKDKKTQEKIDILS